jgi:hypothetical protein
MHAKRDLQIKSTQPAIDTSVPSDNETSISSIEDLEYPSTSTSTTTSEHCTFSELIIDNVGDRIVDGTYQRISVDELEDGDWQRLDDDMGWQTDFGAPQNPGGGLTSDYDSDVEDDGDSEFELENIQIPISIEIDT